MDKQTNDQLTKADIEALIINTKYQRFGETLTICVLTLKNGFHVVGESACISAELFDSKIGQKIAYDNAVEKIWPLEGYARKQV